MSTLAKAIELTTVAANRMTAHMPDNEVEALALTAAALPSRWRQVWTRLAHGRSIGPHGRRRAGERRSEVLGAGAG